MGRCTHWGQMFTPTQGGCDNHKCHKKNPGGNRTRDDIMPGSVGLRILVIFKRKQLVEIRTLASPVGSTECAAQFVVSVSWDLNMDEASPVCGLRDAPRVCWVRWNGQQSNNFVSLSSCWKTKLKKSINVSYLN